MDPDPQSPRRQARQADPALDAITGTVAEWEQWTGMRFPGDSEYASPAGLATVEIARAHNLGSYWEPSVWIVHEL